MSPASRLTVDVTVDPGLPLRLADLHRDLPVGAEVEFTDADDDEDHRLPDLLEGAGFERRAVSSADSRWRATRARTLSDTIGPDLRVCIVGLNPSVYSADAGVAFARPGNRFWPAALDAGLVSRDRDPRHALLVDRVGMTDLVKRATPRADELTADEYRHGLRRLEGLAGWLRPRLVVFVGLTGWRVAVDRHARAGPQERTLDRTRVYVMPSTSGLNAHATRAELAEHLRLASSLVD